MTRKYDFPAFLTIETDSKAKAIAYARALEGPILINASEGFMEATFSLDESEPELLDDEEDEDASMAR